MATVFDRDLAGLGNLLLLHVVPLFNLPLGKRPTLVGCSLLVELGGIRYFVSARHVIDWISAPGGLHYYIDRGKLHRLVGTVVHTVPTQETGMRDAFDVAVVRLEQDALLPSGENWKLPLEIEAIRARDSRRSKKQYLVVGFPKSRSNANPHTRRLKSEPSSFRIISAELADYDHLGLSDATHIVLNLDIDRMHFPDGTVRQIADPHGMSGSPLWLLFDEDGDNDPHVTPVVGIVIEYHKDRKLLVATDIGIALALIEQSGS